MAEKITDLLVRGMKSPAAGNRIVYDSEVRGFGVRITAAGARAFVLNYRVDGAERRLTIGAYPDWSVAAAREQAKALKREVDRGSDPLARRKEDRAAPTVGDLWRRYEAEHLPRKAPRAQADDRAMFRALILPALGRTKVRDVTADDVDALHRDIGRTRPHQAAAGAPGAALGARHRNAQVDGAAGAVGSPVSQPQGRREVRPRAPLGGHL